MGVEIMGAIQTQFAIVFHRVGKLTARVDFIRNTLNRHIDERADRVNKRIVKQFDHPLCPLCEMFPSCSPFCLVCLKVFLDHFVGHVLDTLDYPC